MTDFNQIVVKKQCEFQINELVFVKMTGYKEWWPSRIIYINADANRFIVHFLGDGRRSPQIHQSCLRKIDDHENNEIAQKLHNHAPFMVAWNECLLLIEFKIQLKSFVAQRQPDTVSQPKKSPILASETAKAVATVSKKTEFVPETCAKVNGSATEAVAKTTIELNQSKLVRWARSKSAAAPRQPQITVELIESPISIVKPSTTAKAAVHKSKKTKSTRETSVKANGSIAGAVSGTVIELNQSKSVRRARSKSAAAPRQPQLTVELIESPISIVKPSTTAKAAVHKPKKTKSARETNAKVNGSATGAAAGTAIELNRSKLVCRARLNSAAALRQPQRTVELIESPISTAKPSTTAKAAVHKSKKTKFVPETHAKVNGSLAGAAARAAIELSQSKSVRRARSKSAAALRQPQITIELIESPISTAKSSTTAKAAVHKSKKTKSARETNAKVNGSVPGAAARTAIELSQSKSVRRARSKSAAALRQPQIVVE